MAADEPKAVILNKEDLTASTVRDIFERLDTGLSVSVDQDGDVLLKSTYQFYCLSAPDSDWVRMYIGLKASSGATLGQKLLYVNRVNDEVHGIRAYVRETGGIGLDLSIPTFGGITLLNLVVTAQKFLILVRAALSKDEQDVLV